MKIIFSIHLSIQTFISSLFSRAKQNINKRKHYDLKHGKVSENLHLGHSKVTLKALVMEQINAGTMFNNDTLHPIYSSQAAFGYQHPINVVVTNIMLKITMSGSSMVGQMLKNINMETQDNQEYIY